MMASSQLRWKHVGGGPHATRHILLLLLLQWVMVLLLVMLLLLHEPIIQRMLGD